MNITIDLQGEERLMRKLKNLENPSKAMARGLKNYLGDIKKDIIAYAPESAANRSPGINGYSWYQRGFGTKTITGRRYPRSQRMSTKWKFETRVLSGRVRSKIINNATYSPYVVGDLQAKFHKARGWKRADETIKATTKDAVKLIEKEIDKELNK